MTTETTQNRGAAGFGSTGGLALLTMPMNHRPVTNVMFTFVYKQQQMQALLDTGADITIVTSDQWPSHWPLQAVLSGVGGVGRTATVQRSQRRVRVGVDGHTASIYITVMQLPIGVNALIGCDVLNQLGIVLTTETPF